MLLWTESCQTTTSPTVLARKYFYFSGPYSAVLGRANGPSFAANAVAYPVDPAPSGTTCIMFMRFRMVAAGTASLVFGVNLPSIVSSPANYEAIVKINGDGSVSVGRGVSGSTTFTLLGSMPTGTVSMSNVLHGLAVRFVQHATLGVIEVWLDGVLLLLVAGTIGTPISTVNVGGQWNSVAAAVSGGVYWCDWMVLDGTNPTTNDPCTLIPDVRIDYCPPNGVGSSSQFVSSASPPISNYLEVDETNTDDDTTYVQAAASAIDSYAVQDAPVPGSQIIGLTVQTMVRKGDAGIATHQLGIRSSGTNYMSAVKALPASYIAYTKAFGTNPNGGVAWTSTTFNAIEVVNQRP